MTRALALALAALTLLLPGTAALAHRDAPSGARVVERVSWVEEWDPASQQWVQVPDSPASLTPVAFETSPLPAATSAATTIVSRSGGVTNTETILAPQPMRFIGGLNRPAQAAGIAAFGPFRVIAGGKRAALVAATDAASPQAFAAMLAAYPGIEVIEFADAPGTSHDLANLRLGRAIRAAGLATHVPAGGSARSGAVELFLAGTRRTLDPGALFAVHSWRDQLGREPSDFAPEAPENRLYLDYYAEMGMSADQARAFYSMTNSVPHEGARWMDSAEMARWITPAARQIDGNGEQALRLALLRSAGALAAAVRLPWSLPRASMPEPDLAPVLAYATPGASLLDGAMLGAAVLDSGAAFP